MSGTIKGKCTTDQNPHTRVGACAMFEGTPFGLVFTSPTMTFPADEAAFNTAMQAALTAMGSARAITVMDGIVDLVLTGGDLRTSQEGFGPETPNGINPLREDYTITSGGICLYKELYKLNGRQMRVFKVDDANQIYGTSTVSAAGTTEFKGYLATIGVSRRMNTGSQTGAIILSILYDAKFQTEDANTHSVALTSELIGLSGVVLQKVSTGKARVVLACSGEDITSVYGDKFGVPAVLVAEDGTNPTTITYTEGMLTVSPTTKAYRVADANILVANQITGIEGEPTYVSLA